VDCRAACSLAAVAASSSAENINGTSPASLTFWVFLEVGRESASSLYLPDMALRLCMCAPCGSSWEWRLVAEPDDLVIETRLEVDMGMDVHVGPCEETGIALEGGDWNGGDIEKYPPDGSRKGTEKLVSCMGTGEATPVEKLAEVVGGLVGYPARSGYSGMVGEVVRWEDRDVVGDDGEEPTSEEMWFHGLLRPGELDLDGSPIYDGLSARRPRSTFVLLMVRASSGKGNGCEPTGMDKGVGVLLYFVRTGSSRTKGCRGGCVPYSFFRLKPCTFWSELTKLGVEPFCAGTGAAGDADWTS